MPAQPFTASSELSATWKKYRHLWKNLKTGARQLLLKEGEISRKIFVIEKGCIRNWFYHNGREISFQFFFEGDVVSSPESFRNNSPSAFNIETVEPVILRWLDQKDLEIIKQEPILYDSIVERAAYKQAEFMRHFFSYLKDTPQKRYENLINEKPEIIRRVPLQHIASYLGITAVSLSRIRSKI